MKKLFVVLSVILAYSPLASANRFGDAWGASHSRFRKHFYPRERHPGFEVGLFLTSSTTETTSSMITFTTGGDLLKPVATRDRFIDENLYAIKLDSAKGQGEYLRTLAVLSGCDKAQSQFASTIRSNFKEVYGLEEDPAAIADQIDRMIEDDSSLHSSCHLIGS